MHTGKDKVNLGFACLSRRIRITGPVATVVGPSDHHSMWEMAELLVEPCAIDLVWFSDAPPGGTGKGVLSD
jgi:hypothetical protein